MAAATVYPMADSTEIGSVASRVFPMAYQMAATTAGPADDEMAQP